MASPRPSSAAGARVRTRPAPPVRTAIGFTVALYVALGVAPGRVGAQTTGGVAPPTSPTSAAPASASTSVAARTRPSRDSVAVSHARPAKKPPLTPEEARAAGERMNVGLKQQLLTAARAGGARVAPRDLPPPLMRDITLSEAQKAVLRPGWQREQPRARALAERRRLRSASTPADAEEMRAISARSMAAVQGVLTPDQRAQYDRNVAARRAWIAAHGMTQATTPLVAPATTPATEPRP